MIAILFIVIGVILIVVLFIGYSSRNKKNQQTTPPVGRTDLALDPDKKRATGVGED